MQNFTRYNKINNNKNTLKAENCTGKFYTTTHTKKERKYNEKFSACLLIVNVEAVAVVEAVVVVVRILASLAPRKAEADFRI